MLQFFKIKINNQTVKIDFEILKMDIYEFEVVGVEWVVGDH